MTMLLLFNPVEFGDSCQEEGAFELSFGREVSQADKAGRARHSRDKHLEWSSHRGPRKHSVFCKQKETQDAWTLGMQGSVAER